MRWFTFVYMELSTNKSWVKCSYSRRNYFFVDFVITTLVANKLEYFTEVHDIVSIVFINFGFLHDQKKSRKSHIYHRSSRIHLIALWGGSGFNWKLDDKSRISKLNLQTFSQSCRKYESKSVIGHMISFVTWKTLTFTSKSVTDSLLCIMTIFPQSFRRLSWGNGFCCWLNLGVGLREKNKPVSYLTKVIRPTWGSNPRPLD